MVIFPFRSKSQFLYNPLGPSAFPRTKHVKKATRFPHPLKNNFVSPPKHITDTKLGFPKWFILLITVGQKHFKKKMKWLCKIVFLRDLFSDSSLATHPTYTYPLFYCSFTC